MSTEIAGLEMAVTHLNAAVGRVLTAERLADALRCGMRKSGHSDDMQSAMISTLFHELSPELIFRCAREAGSDIGKANALYLESLADWPRVPAWEDSVRFFVQ